MKPSFVIFLFLLKQLLPVSIPVPQSMGERNMQTAGQQMMKEVQAINEDFENTDYDRGHLNPNSYQCGDSRTATFTLTNAVPQDPCFNQQSWKKMEKVSLKTMRANCTGGVQYFVTGVVRSRIRIPNEEHDVVVGRNRVYNRVTVPSHMWTAACCYDPTNQANGFSFAYIGKNAADSVVEIMSVSALEAKLVSNELGIDRYESAKIFVDDCNESRSKSIRDKVAVPMDIRVANTLDVLSRVEQESIPGKKRKLVQQAVSLITSNEVVAYDSSFARIDLGMTLERNNTLLNETRELLLDKGTGLLLYKANDLTPGTRPAVGHLGGELDAYGIHPSSTKQDKNKTVSRSRPYLDALDAHKQGGVNDQASTPVEDEYLIVPNLSAAGSEVTLQGDRCINSSCSVGGGTFHRWCYTDWSKTQGQCCVSECKFRAGKDHQTCFTGASNTDEKACSSRFSAIAVSGQPCLAEHECGLHGKGYYWCYIDIKKNWHYCCQPWHACAKYTKNYDKWCYAGKTKQSQWKYCYY